MPASALWRLPVQFPCPNIPALHYVSFAFCPSTGKLLKYEKLASDRTAASMGFSACRSMRLYMAEGVPVKAFVSADK